MILNAVLIAAIGLLAGMFGGVASLVAATGGALIWGLIAGWVLQLSPGQAVLRLVVLIVSLQVAFLIGLALRTIARR